MALLATILAIVANRAMAQTNLVQNPTFAITGGTDQTSMEFGAGCGTNCAGLGSVADWSTSGYNFVFLPNTADVTGGTGSSGNVKLWGPNDNGGTANGLPTQGPSAGQNFVAADGAYEVSAITQTINGLYVGQPVAVSFSWAGAQQYTYNGVTTDEWTVDLGSSPTQSTSILTLPSNGASAWVTQTFYFIATSTSESLSFLAAGTPSGQPPFALLANVSVTNVQEPGSLAVIVSGIVGLTALRRPRLRRPRARGAAGAIA